MKELDNKIVSATDQEAEGDHGHNPYSAPKLRIYGAVGTLTQSGTGLEAEMMPGAGGPFMEDVFP